MTALAERATTVYGSTTPRLWTRPLVTGPAGPCECGCALTPATSAGFETVAFAEDVVGVDLYPWQRWWLIHALELREGGRFRYRTILTLVSRQNGKTFLIATLALWSMFLAHRKGLVLGAAQSLDVARSAWRATYDLAAASPELAPELGKKLDSVVEYSFATVEGAKYRISAANEKSGRGLSVDLLILDELRTHYDASAWASLASTTMARPNSLIVGISNAGDDRAVVLNGLRSAALAGDDDSLGLFEWSAPDGCALDDVQAWAQANPSLGHGALTLDALRSMRSASPSPATFQTENLCQRVDSLDAAVDAAAWRACALQGVTLESVRDQLVACVDVSYDDGHVSAVAAAPDGDRVRVEVLGAWGSTAEARDELPQLLGALRPRAVGWFPGGPTAVLGAELRALHGTVVGRKVYARDEMHPHSPGVVELGGGVAVEACQTLADLVISRRIVHPNDALINAHIAASVRKDQGDGWRFARKGAARNDAAYATAGAVHLARTLPLYKPASRPKIY